MKGRKSKQCCCKAAGNCLSCLDGACTWTVHTGSFSYGGGEWSGSEGGIQSTDLGYPWTAPTYSEWAHTRASAIVRLNDGDGVRIIGDIDNSGGGFKYSWVGISKDFGKVFMSVGRIGDVPTDVDGTWPGYVKNWGRLWESHNCTHDKIVGCVDGEIEVFLEACFVGDGAPQGRAPLFGATITNKRLGTGRVATIPTAVGMYLSRGAPGVKEFTAQVARTNANCPFCGTEADPEVCDRCLPNTTPQYLDVTFPKFTTEGPTCSPSCATLSEQTLRVFQYTDSNGQLFPCTYRVTTNGMCFTPIPVFGGVSDSIALTVGVAEIADDLGSYLEMELRAVGGTQSITWQTDATVPNGPARLGPIPQGEHGLYWPDFNTYDCGCYLNERQWQLRANNWLYLNTVCRAMGPVVTTCPVRVF